MIIKKLLLTHYCTNQMHAILRLQQEQKNLPRRKVKVASKLVKI